MAGPCSASMRSNCSSSARWLSLKGYLAGRSRTGSCSHGIRFLDARAMAAIVTAEERSRNEQNKRGYDAAFRAHNTAGEPCGAAQYGVQEIVIGCDAAIRNSVKESLAPVISSVESHGAPETSRRP